MARCPLDIEGEQPPFSIHTRRDHNNDDEIPTLYDNGGFWCHYDYITGHTELEVSNCKHFCVNFMSGKSSILFTDNSTRSISFQHLSGSATIVAPPTLRNIHGISIHDDVCIEIGNNTHVFIHQRKDGTIHKGEGHCNIYIPPNLRDDDGGYNYNNLYWLFMLLLIPVIGIWVLIFIQKRKKKKQNNSNDNKDEASASIKKEEASVVNSATASKVRYNNDDNSSKRTNPSLNFPPPPPVEQAIVVSNNDKSNNNHYYDNNYTNNNNNGYLPGEEGQDNNIISSTKTNYDIGQSYVRRMMEENYDNLYNPYDDTYPPHAFSGQQQQQDEVPPSQQPTTTRTIYHHEEEKKEDVLIYEC